MKKAIDSNTINKRLIDYLLKFPTPYTDILREQIAACQISNELYPDCYIIHFHHKETGRQLPLWLPVLLQGCQVLKENGPLSCQLFVESGFITQFEVVDMGMNEIDWEYLWAHRPIFDVEYDLPTICECLTTDKVNLSAVRVLRQNVYCDVNTPTGRQTLCLLNSNILTLDLPDGRVSGQLEICHTGKEERPFLVKLNDNRFVIECSLVCLKDILRTR